MKDLDIKLLLKQSQEYAKCNYEKAIKLGKKALTDSKKKYSKRSIEYVECLDNIILILKENEGDEEMLMYQKEILNQLALIYNLNKVQIDKNASIKEFKNYLQDYLLNLVKIFEKYYHQEKKFSKSEEVCEEAVKLTKGCLGTENIVYATWIDYLGCVLHKQNKNEKAEELQREALQIKKRLLDTESYAETLTNLALTLEAKGKFEEAEENFREVVKIIEKNKKTDITKYEQYLFNLARALDIQHKYSEADKYYREAMEQQVNIYGAEHPYYIESLSNYGNVLRHRGYYERAKRVLREAKEHQEKISGEGDIVYAAILEKLALVYLDQGDYDEAELLFMKRIEVADELTRNDFYHYSMNRFYMGEVKLRKGNIVGAAECYREALDVYENKLSKICSLYPRILASYGYVIYISNKQSKHTHYLYECPKKLLTEAVKVKRDTLKEYDLDYANILVSLAKILADEKEYEQAEELFEEAVAIGRNILQEEHYQYVELLKTYSIYKNDEGDFIKGSELIQEAIDLENKIVTKFIHGLPEKARISVLEKYKITLDLYLSQILQNKEYTLYKSDKIFDQIISRKGIDGEVSMTQREIILSKTYPHLNDKFNELKILRQKIANIILNGQGDKRDYKSYQKMIKELEREKNELESEIGIQIPEIHLNSKLEKATSQELKSALRSDEVLIEFVCFNYHDYIKRISEKKYIVFILHPQKQEESILIDLGSAEFIDKLVLDFIKEVNSVELSIQLRTKLWDPLVEHLKGKTNIVICPDGELSKLPFEILYDEEENHLIDKYKIGYMNTARDLLRVMDKNIINTENTLIISNPKYDFEYNMSQTVNKENENRTRARGSRSVDIESGELLCFTALPATAIEGEVIGNLLGVEPITQENALVSRVKEVKNPKLVHIATHGFFLKNQQKNQHNDDFFDMNNSSLFNRSMAISKAENPLLRSGLALSGVNTWLRNRKLPIEAEDGLLTAEEVSCLDLRGTELVVLSACETGLGEYKTGEGVYGLRRSFILAGAKCLVMSLWNVDDFATTILMERFYANMINGKLLINESLREAQMYLRNLRVCDMRQRWLSEDMESKLPTDYVKELRCEDDDYRPFQDPYYWGGFIFQGAPNTVIS